MTEIFLPATLAYPGSLLQVALQALPVITPSDVQKIADSDLKGILVWGVYAVFGTMFLFIVALAKGWRDEVKANKNAQEKAFEILRDTQEKATELLLQFSQSMSLHVEAMKTIPQVIERHERDAALSRQQHEAYIRTLVTEMREEMKRRGSRQP